MRCAAEKARAKNHVGLALDQRREHQGILGGIVFQIGVLNDDEVARGFLNAAAEGCSLAHVMRLKHHADGRIFGLQGSQNLSRTVLRAIVDADQLDFYGNG